MRPSKPIPSPSLADSAATLRAALLKLKPAGPKGFEGLLAVILTKITGQNFRLASSGLQLGIDGGTLAGLSHISFEAKLYKAKINPSEVLTKITSIIASLSPPDLWVLGATTGGGTQMLGTLQAAANKNGIATLILDWPDAAHIPPLAAACALASDETAKFLADHIADKALIKGAANALKALSAASELAAATREIVDALSPASLGMPLALKANAAWLGDTFADADQARMLLGQKLAPRASWPLPTQERETLTSALRGRLEAPPEGRMVAVIGGEGVGKSWLVAQTWGETTPRPLSLFVPATGIRNEDFIHFERLLIAKFIEQTGDSPNEFTQKIWENRLARWRNLPAPDAPYFTFCIDGLNQHSSFDWPRFLSGAASKLAKLGGLLVVTDRAPHFNALIDSLSTTVDKILVPEWSLEELGKILQQKGIDPASLRREVQEGLRNPRVLSIAFELLERRSIESFDELSVSRLMFEHIRIGARDGAAAPEPPVQFVKRIAQHAQEILNRVRSQEHEDRLVFESGGEKQFELKPDLLAVTAERFFHPLSNDPTLYTLSNEGLSFALALSIIDTLKKAERNSQNLREKLDALLDPIAALDKTSEAILDAALISSVDDDCSNELCAALLSSYLQLQNVDDDTFAAFCGSVRHRAEAAMLALQTVTNNGEGTGRSKWLIAALRKVRSEPGVLEVISPHLSRWLSTYSLAPERRAYSRRSDEPQKYDEEISRAKVKLQEVESGLSHAEKEFRSKRMIRADDVDPSPLGNAAFQILAGMRLADFANDFVAWAYSNSLNSSWHGTQDQFYALIRFNASDWVATRDAILCAGAFLTNPDVSQTGKWALVYLLRATATEEDAAQENALVAELTADREKRSGWRLVEKYCSTDPCDPASQKADNVDDTADELLALDVTTLSSHEGVTQTDNFFWDALPGVARFRPDAALQVIRRYAASAENRSGRFLLFCVTSLKPHSGALDQASVETLLQVGRSYMKPRIKGASDEDWISSQYALLAAFPHLDGETQLAKLRGLPVHNAPMLQLIDAMKDASSDDVEQALQDAIASGQEDWKLTILAFTYQQQGPLTDKTREMVGELAFDNASTIRGEAMGLLAKLGDKTLLRKVIDSGWTAKALEGTERSFEAWHGSHLVLEAAKLGLLSAVDALDRISLSLFGLAASKLGDEVNAHIAARLTVALERALGAEIVSKAPRAEQQIAKRMSSYPSLLSLADSRDDDDDGSISDAMRKLNDTPQAFAQRQRDGWTAFSRFEAELTQQGARLIIEDISKFALKAAISSSQDWGRDTAELLLGASEFKIYHAQNFALKLARELSESHPALSRQLFERVRGMDGFMNVVYRPSGVSLEALCAWGSARNAEWDELRFRRLDAAANDQALAHEVVAALMMGQAELLEVYVKEKLARPEPASINRALTILGFGEVSDLADAMISKYEGTGGFIGHAAKQARYAYDRNRWSQHWYGLMGEANSGAEFWRSSVLLHKIVDGRLTLWQRDLPKDGGPAALFEPLLDGEFERRIKDWEKKREKRLVGSDAPARIYVEAP